MELRRQSLLRSVLADVLYALLALSILAISLEKVLALPGYYTAQSLATFIAFLLILSPLLPQHLPLDRFGSANQITLVRAGMVALTAGLISTAPLTTTQGWLAVTLAGLALLLDGVDGWLARRLGLASPFGARFDMETDALLILVMALLWYQSGKAGGWVLLSGLMRYGFIALGQIWSWLNQPLPPCKRRQTICVIQSLGLIAGLIPVIVPPSSVILAAVTLTLLTLSFAIDIVWLARRATAQEKTRSLH